MYDATDRFNDVVNLKTKLCSCKIRKLMWCHYLRLPQPEAKGVINSDSKVSYFLENNTSGAIN